MSKLWSLVLLLALVAMAACFPGGTSSSPAASPAVSEKQQAVNFLKAAAPVEKEVAGVDADMVNLLDNMSKLTKDVRDARMADFASRIKAARAKAAAIPRPAPAEAAAFYDKWLKATTTYEAFITNMSKGDFDAAGKAQETLTPDYQASDAALAALLGKYGITKAEVGWPS